MQILVQFIEVHQTRTHFIMADMTDRTDSEAELADFLGNCVCSYPFFSCCGRYLVEGLLPLLPMVYYSQAFKTKLGEPGDILHADADADANPSGGMLDLMGKLIMCLITVTACLKYNLVCWFLFLVFVLFQIGSIKN